MSIKHHNSLRTLFRHKINNLGGNSLTKIRNLRKCQMKNLITLALNNNEIVDTESLIEWGVRPKWNKLILEANKQQNTISQSLTFIFKMPLCRISQIGSYLPDLEACSHHRIRNSHIRNILPTKFTFRFSLKL